MEEEDPPCLPDAGNLTIAGLADAGNPTFESWNVVVVEALVTPFKTELVSRCVETQWFAERTCATLRRSCAKELCNRDLQLFEACAKFPLWPNGRGALSPLIGLSLSLSSESK